MSATRVRLDPAERRRQLLDLGLDMLSVKRLEELSIDALAEVAGISRGLLYHYFSSKREFHLAILRRMADEVVAITAPSGQGDPLSQLVGSLDAYVDFVTANHDAYSAFVRAAAGGDEDYRAIYVDARTALTDRVFDTAGAEVLAAVGIVDSPAVRLMVWGWSAMVEDVLLTWIDDDRGVTREQLLDMLAGALAGLGATATSASRHDDTA